MANNGCYAQTVPAGSTLSALPLLPQYLGIL